VPVSIRKIGDEIGYVLKSGLYLTISEPRSKDGQWVHEFRHGIANKDAIELDNTTEDFKFLKALKEGASLFMFNDHPFSIDLWGNLKHLGPDIENLETVFMHLKRSFSGLYLADIVEQGVLISTGISKAFIDGIGVEQIFPGFVYDQVIKGGLQDSAWKPCKFRIPIVMNLKSFGLIVWSSGRGSVYMADNVICGFRPELQEQWEFEVSEQTLQTTSIPELWLYKNWPPIPINFAKPNDCISVKFENELPFAGEFYDLQN
ncbi:hypothetical protein KAR91_51655, partial [Candidatus Pacearchaeota archaeon]|nr:hypothetical protein [Candidatus Pacearchaeota archaeon]